ncbi:DUF4214 domain-containing protein [Marinobacter bryozoorum]|uniref:DUF4214 domain-containing protein n=1 Tax=Marinobacter bryozoorum TaxID=256324 RepID=UPI002003C5B8|nr:DUF4214 domain-containing protein [Marinobacter bryozoorum]MCK7542776.1 DUF4214 domain-containing protein [Marinobacter bryozoorum]
MTRYISDAASQYPYSSVAYIEAVFPDGSRVSGSGVLVGRNDVLTAAHVIYDQDRGWAAESVQVTPGRDGAGSPLGSFDGALLNYFEIDAQYSGSLTQSESEQDLALIGLDQAVGDQLGWFGMGSFVPGENYRVTGYPGAYQDYSGPRMVEDSGYASADRYFDLISLNGFDISPGSSGGPVWYGPASSPVLVGTVSTDGWATAVDGQFETVESWITGNDHLIPAPAPELTPEQSLIEQAFDQLEAEGWSVPAGLADDIVTTDLLLDFPDLDAVIDPVLRLYTGMLGRQPDRSGVEYWVRELNEGGSLQQLARSFVDSNEFQALANSLGGGMEGAIEALYRNVLDRSPDSDGFRYWQEALQSGRLDLAGVAVSFTESTEYIATSENLVQGAKPLLWGVNLQDMNPAGLGFDLAAFAAEQQEAETIVRLYTGVLDRQPDVSGFDYWLDEAGDVISLSGLAESFLASDEFWLAQPDTNPGALVDYLYQQVLDRPADASGRSYWLDELDNGFGLGDLVLSFVNSAEYVRQTDPLVDQFLLDNYDGGLVGVPVDLETYLIG